MKELLQNMSTFFLTKRAHPLLKLFWAIYYKIHHTILQNGANLLRSVYNVFTNCDSHQETQQQFQNCAY